LIEFSLCVPLPHGLNNRFGILVVVGLQIRATGKTIANVLPLCSSNASNPIDCFVGSVARREYRLPWFIFTAQDVLGIHASWFSDPG
jgi:hypothetical protein